MMVFRIRLSSTENGKMIMKKTTVGYRIFRILRSVIVVTGYLAVLIHKERLIRYILRL